MRISEIRLENFKCFTNLTAKVNKLTLITGANSSGKSSFLYGLLTPFHSGSFPFNFSTNGKFVNMGDFQDISHAHKSNNRIKIGFTIDLRDETPKETGVHLIDTYWVIDKTRKLPKLHSMEAKGDSYNLKISLDKDEKYSLSFSYDQAKDKNTEERYQFQYKINTLLFETLEQPNTSKRPDKYIRELEASFKRNDKKIQLIAPTLQELFKESRSKGSYALNSTLHMINNLFSSLDEKINYISSFRFHPQKIRNEITKDNLRVGKYGDNYEDQILNWDTNKDDKFKVLINKLKQIGILEDIKPSRITGGNYELRIKTHNAGVFSSLSDVGFGISQFLPIIVSDIQLGKNSSLFISQPELHLHPKIQSEFGDYLINEMKENNKNYIVETHSEYLINKIRLLIVEKKLKPEDISIYYFQKKGNTTKNFELEFTVDGQIINAPSDFFDTYMTDVINIALKA